MYLYDILAIICTGLSHFFLYFYLIRYERISFPIIILISLVFTVLLSIIITVTGYPEFNAIVMALFLLSLGLLQIDMTFMENLYFTLGNIVSISLLKIVLVEIGSVVYLWLPFNLYVWTPNVIHMVVTILIFIAILLLRTQIGKFAQYIVTSRLYYVSYVVLAISFVIIFLLTIPGSKFLFQIYTMYGDMMFTAAFILFFVLLLIVIIGSHLTKERLVQRQQAYLDDELLAYVKKLELLHDDLTSFRHDYINLLLTLDTGVRTKDIAQIERTYYDIIAPTSELINNCELEIIKLANVEQAEVKSLLSVKVFEAEQQGVDVTLDIPLPIGNIPMSLVHFIRIISILVDNGIEAAENSEDKILQIAFFEQENTVYFIVRNSVAENATIDLTNMYAKNYSTKAEQRGYGLYSLKYLIAKTKNATLDTEWKGSFFTQTYFVRR